MKDLYQQMTDLILNQVDEAGAWKPCLAGVTGGLPLNHTTGAKYRGVNILSCWVAQMIHGFTEQRWASFKQWQAIGGSVRKGAKGTPIIYYGIREKEDGTEQAFARGSYVFNIAQVDGVASEADSFEPLDEATRIARIEHWLMQRRDTVRIEHDPADQRAYFRPSTDSINMPAFERFKDAEHYYSVLFHEMTHWTGAKTRLARAYDYAKTGDRAREELVAELGAAFLAAEHGIAHATRDDHVNYVASWLTALKNDKRAIITAASQASAAVTYLETLELERKAA